MSEAKSRFSPEKVAILEPEIQPLINIQNPDALSPDYFHEFAEKIIKQFLSGQPSGEGEESGELKNLIDMERANQLAIGSVRSAVTRCSWITLTSSYQVTVSYEKLNDLPLKKFLNYPDAGEAMAQFYKRSLNRIKDPNYDNKIWMNRAAGLISEKEGVYICRYVWDVIKADSALNKKPNP